VDLTVSFHGLLAASPLVVLNGSDSPCRIDVRAPLISEELAPSATLTTLRRTLRPDKSLLRVMQTTRDKTPAGQQLFELLATYSFKMVTLVVFATMICP